MKTFNVVMTREVEAYRVYEFEVVTNNEKEALELIKDGMVEPFRSHTYVGGMSNDVMVEEINKTSPCDSERIAGIINEVLGEGFYYECEDEEYESHADGEENLKQ